jgi:hypothetical protein
VSTIKLGDVITPDEAKELVSCVSRVKAEGYTKPTVHHRIMTWLGDNPEVRERWQKLGVSDAYGAYMLEYHLQIK